MLRGQTDMTIHLRWLILATIAVGCGAASLIGQEARPVPEDAMSRPTEYGIRFTPGMAREMSDQFTKHLLRGQYQLPEDKVKEASESVTRRIMEAVHEADKEGRGQDLAEFAVTEMFNAMANVEPGSGLDGMPQGLGTGIGQRILPMMPAIHDLIKNVGQDIRPMLPMKSQLTFGRHLMLAKTGLNAFEKNMQRWADGKVDPYGNPFEDRDKEIETDENGESDELKGARNRAEGTIGKGLWSGWEGYVEDANVFYELNESQSATADSVLRELTERAESTTHDESWREQAYRNRLISFMRHALALARNNPIRILLNEQYEQLTEPIKALETELKQRIDDIPTQAQRTAAEERIMAALVEQGFDPEAGEEDEEPEETAEAKEEADIEKQEGGQE